MKTLTIRQFATIKRVAQNVNPLVIKKNKIMDKINELNAEYNALTEEIEGHEMGIKALTGGYVSEDLVVKVVEETGKTDKNGNVIKVTKYEPREDKVTYNEETKTYTIVEEPTVEESVEIESISEESVDMVEAKDALDFEEAIDNNPFA